MIVEQRRPLLRMEKKDGKQLEISAWKIRALLKKGKKDNSARNRNDGRRPGGTEMF